MEVILKNLENFKYGDSKTFSYQEGDVTREGFLIKVQEGYRAYVNNCPHWNTPLEMGEGNFFNERINRISCQVHGAAFNLETGDCEGGPCMGDSLQTLLLEVSSDSHCVTITTPD